MHNDFAIGDWVERQSPRTLAHLVESLVGGDAVTRCGRRMARRFEGDLQRPVRPLRCKRCNRQA
jgi:hypothetical protein